MRSMLQPGPDPYGVFGVGYDEEEEYGATAGGGVSVREPMHPRIDVHAQRALRYVDLVRAADAALVKCGHTSLEDRIHMLSGIYYGTTWSRDFDVEKSPVRNAAFQAFLARAYGSGDDPRPCLGYGLYLSLKRSQDVAGVDMGQVMIGLNARMRFASREVTVPSTSSTGLDITTWVGDLAGASARVALDRVRLPKAPATRYFGGTDYGAKSNLEGDLGAFLVASGGSAGIVAPSIPAGGSIADAFKEFFIDRIGFPNRCRRFLAMQGATFTSGKLTNRAAVKTGMADKFEGFGRRYLTNFVRQKGLDPLLVPRALLLLRRAAEDVADVFIGKLVTCRL